MLFLCVIISFLAGNKYIQSNKKQKKIDFSNFKSQISKLEKQIELENKKYTANKNSYVKFIESKPINSKRKGTQISIELNSADTTELKKLYGIGSVLSNRIVKYRDLLGGFYSKKQLLDVYGMDTSTFEDFKHQIFVDLSLVQKIDINFANANELSKYPFISYKLANSIVNYIGNHGAFSQGNQLMNLYLMDSLTFNKMLPYIDFDD